METITLTKLLLVFMDLYTEAFVLNLVTIQISHKNLVISDKFYLFIILHIQNEKDIMKLIIHRLLFQLTICLLFHYKLS